MKNQLWTALLYLSVGLLLGMFVHAWFYRPDSKDSPDGPEVLAQIGKSRDVPETADEEVDISSSQQLVAALFPGARIGGGETSAEPDPATRQIQIILRNPVSSYSKVANLLNLAKTLPPEKRRLAYAGAAFACEAREFQQLMLPLVWDPATPPDQAQVLAGGVIGLPDPVRLPICLTFLKHPDESVRLTGQNVLAAYFPDAEESAYPAAVQSYLAKPH